MKRLRIYFLAFFVLLAVPCSILLMRTYANLRQEAFFFYRKTAEGLVAGFHQRLLQRLASEERRPFTQYRYIHVADQPIPDQEGLNVSPLAVFPVESDIPGVLGYFQIDPDGSFHTPLLPDSETSVNRTVPDREVRIQIRDRLASLLEGANFRTAFGGVAGRLETDELMARLVRNLESEVDRRLEDQYSREQQATSLLERSGQETGEDSEVLARQVQKSSPRQAVVFDSEMGKAKVDRLETREQIGEPALSETFRDRQDRRTSREKEAEEGGTTAVRSQDDSAGGRLNQANLSEEVTAEVDAFRVTLVGNEWLAFYRRVWWQDRRYIQGFVSRADTFLEEQLRPLLQNSALPADASYLVFYRGELLKSARTADGVISRPLLLVSSTLPHPLTELHLAVTVGELPKSPGYQVVNALAIFLTLLVIGGLFGMYRLTAGQMELSQKKSDFVAAVSHELKTPLASIRMYGEMLVEGWVGDQEKRQTYYRHIHDEAERLSRLIQNVLRLAELERGEWRLQPTALDPAPFVQALVERLGQQIEQAGFEVVTRVEGTPRTIDLDADALTQILINLIDNAIKFSAKAETRKVLFTISQDADACSIRVRDFGPGIPRRRLKRVFERFYRIDSELTRGTRGTGIGLALVKMLTEAMGGHVSVANRNPGVEFTVRFPTTAGSTLRT